MQIDNNTASNATITLPQTGSTPQDTDMFTNNVNNAKASALKTKMGSTSAAANMAKIDDTSEKFEAQFVSEMVGTMFNTVEDDAVTGGGTGGQMYKSFLADEYGKIITKAGGIGIADNVKRELLKLQEAENHGGAQTTPNGAIASTTVNLTSTMPNADTITAITAATSEAK